MIELFTVDPDPIVVSLGLEANANFLDDTDAKLHCEPDSLLHDPRDQVIHVTTTVQSKLHMAMVYIYTSNEDIEAKKQTTACIVRYVESMFIYRACYQHKLIKSSQVVTAFIPKQDFVI